MMGKASFAHILDAKGQIQIYVKIDNVGADAYEEWKKADIGDIFGVEGTVFMTHKGEISVSAEKMVLLTKSLLPLPEKWHGLKDNDLRYRQRYVDLIANPSVKDAFVMRSRIIKAIRDLLDSKGFVEVETPSSIRLRAAQTRVLSSRITILSTLICICASRPSFILKDLLSAASTKCTK